MNPQIAVGMRAIGIVIICVGIHLGLSTTPGLIVFGCGMAFLFLP